MCYVLKRWRGISAAALCAAVCAALTALLMLAAAGSALAGNGIMLQVNDAPLKDVVNLLMQQSGANVVIADSAMLEKRITASLNDVPLEKVLDYIVKSAGVSFKKMADGTYIIGGSFAEEPVIEKTSVPEALPPVEIEPAAPPPPKEKMLVSIKLIHSKPSEILRLIGWEGVNPMPNTEPYFPDRTNINEPPRNPGGVYMNTSDGRLYDTGKGIQMRNNQPVVPTIDPASLNPGAGRTADQYTGAGQYTDATIRPGYPPGTQPRPTTTTTQPQQTTQQTGNFLWPEGVDDARPFDLDNSIIVKGDEDGIEKFKKIIRMLDVPPKQVQVKAEFVEVSTTDIKNFGIDWSLQRLNESFATAFGPQGNIIVGFATGNLTAQLRTQLTSDVGRIINAPIISTINNQNAYISINTIIPYWVSIATVVDNNIINQSTPQFINIQTHLDVLPRVNGDGTITMILRPGISDTGAQVTGPDGTSIPEQRTQELMTQRRVANGETIVVGGFIRKEDSNSIQKIPVLADLPIVGSLFRTTARKQVERELLIFITPTIIPEVGGGTVGEMPIP